MTAEAPLSERIRQLAENLKRLHLAATMEEAIQRAKEMIGEIKTEEKSISELHDELEQAESVAAQDEQVHAQAHATEETVERQADQIEEQLAEAKKDIDETKKLIDAQEEKDAQS